MRRHAARPFTLIELIAVMGVLILLAATAIPAYSSLFSGRKTTLAANQVNAAVIEARAHAVSSKCYTAIVFVKYDDEKGYRAFRLAEVYHDPDAPESDTNFEWRRWVPGSSFVLLPENTMIPADTSNHEKENLGKTKKSDGNKGETALTNVKNLPTKANDSSENDIMPNGENKARAIFFKPNGQLAGTMENNVVVRFVESNKYADGKRNSSTPKLPLFINWLTCKTKFMDPVL